ncbi:MAG TPA: N-acetylglucosamine-6-phosphate deacetylase [Firmicutes bacterium]|nr:N-acetylglucosamine-6-phosphate deacetylase [Bacillota bacterium]
MIWTGGYVLDETFTWKQADVQEQNGKIIAITAPGQLHKAEQEIQDITGKFLIPGLVDIHTHGCIGEDYSDQDPGGLPRMAAYMAEQGITSFCAATITQPAETLEGICRVLGEYIRTQDVRTAQMRGIYLEGPFLSREHRGAHDERFLRNPDLQLFDRLQTASNGQIRIVALAPELSGAQAFALGCCTEVAVAMAHTAIDYDGAVSALKTGRYTGVTHLYNGMPAMSHRSPGPAGAALESSCMLELIADGIHVSPMFVRMTFQLAGRDRIILISDSMRAAGMPDGEYTLGGLMVTVRGRHAQLQDGRLAGSCSNLMECVRQAVSFGIPLEQAVQAATINPASWLGLDEQIGSIGIGKDADLVVLDQDIQVCQVYRQGIPVRAMC